VADLTSTDQRSRRQVAYITSHFPSVTQTFVFREVLELKRRGWDVQLHAFVRSGLPPDVHPEAAALAEQCVYPSVRSVTRAQLWWLRRHPRAYGAAWAFALRGNWPKLGRLLRAVAVVPVAALFARDISSRGITHTHAHWATAPALAASLIARLTGGSYSFTAHAYDIQLDRTMLRQKAEGAAFVATISDVNRLSLERWFKGSSARVTVVHCGVDLHQFMRRSVPPAGPPFVIVNVGALEVYKGQRHLLGAIAILRRQGYDAVLQLVGGGSQRTELERRAIELGIAPAVQFLGVLSADAVRRSLERAHAFALPSVELANGLTEGIPVAIMEAMATGVPVTASRVSAIHELVSHGATGLLVPPGDDEALAASLRCLIDDAELAARLARTASLVVADEFDLRQTTEQLECLFIDALSRRY
jgi:colanic acid/amylovoran biosynthesis glycosyltransferase